MDDKVVFFTYTNAVYTIKNGHGLKEMAMLCTSFIYLL